MLRLPAWERDPAGAKVPASFPLMICSGGVVCSMQAAPYGLQFSPPDGSVQCWCPVRSLQQLAGLGPPAEISRGKKDLTNKSLQFVTSEDFVY